MRLMTRSVAFLTAVVFLAACQDRTPTAPSHPIADWRAANGNPTANFTACTDLQALNTQVDVVFSGMAPDANSVKSKIDQIDKALKKGDTKKAQEHAFNAVRFIFLKFRGPKPLAGGGPAVGALITHVFCFAGINITVSDPANAAVVDPSTQTQVVKSADSTAGTQLPGGSITEPTVLEFHRDSSFTPSRPGDGPLSTQLDQYPGFYLITAGSASGSGPAKQVTVAICLDASISLAALPPQVRARLRLGHQKDSTHFEIAPPAPDVSFLKCPAPTPSVGFLPGWMNKALGMLLPRTLYAAEEFDRGVGGLATEFSPFDPVDPELSFDRGVGGLATEFKRSSVDPKGKLPFGPSMRRSIGNAGELATPGVNASVTVSPAPECATFPWGTLTTLTTSACQPNIIVKTRIGTPMSGVPVSWSIGRGGGTIAVGPVCANVPDSDFHAMVSTTTDADGSAKVCWKMGPAPDTNTVSATPSVGGDAVPAADVVFFPATGKFIATAIMRTPVVNVTCVNAVYNGAPHGCTATATDPVAGGTLGTVPLDVTYVGTAPVTAPTTTAPTNAGTYTANASYGGSALLYYSPAVTPPPKTLEITKATPTVSLTCTASVLYYNGLDQDPCSASATGVLGADLGSVPVTYLPTPPHNVGTYTADASYAGSTNYTSASAHRQTFEIRFIANGLLGSSSDGDGGRDTVPAINPGRVFTINASTGTATLFGVAPTVVLSFAGVAELSSIEVDPTTGTLYGIAGSACSGAKLITIDRTTGAETFVGGFVGAGFNGTNGARCVGGSDALAIASDGTMYASGWNGGAAGGSLLKIDKNTGAVLTRFSTTGLIHLSGLAFDGTGRLWASRGGNALGVIHIIDPTNGQTVSTLTLRASVGGPQDPAKISDLALGAGGVMYATLPSENKLATIDLVTGVVTRIGSLGGAVNKMSGLAFGR